MVINGVYLSHNEMSKITGRLEAFFKTEIGKKMIEKTKANKEDKVMR